MKFTKTETVDEGVLECDFSVEVAGLVVPCVLWRPASSLAARVLLAMGHGGSRHKKTRGVRNRAIRYAKRHGWVSLAIDAPLHGDRISRAEAEAERRKTEARVRGDADAPAMSPKDKIEYLDHLARQAVPEWQAALDAVLGMGVADGGAIGYWGVSMGTSIGVPLLAVERRFKCAVLGLAQLHPDHSDLREAARRVTVPLRYAFQWDDPIRDRRYGLDLFDAFGSREKSMHINPGGHREIPSAESESWEVFYQRHL